MATLRELIYMVLDELKLSSDDSFFNEEHVAFLINKYRSFILKQQYKDIRKDIPESNYQTIDFHLIQVPAISGIPCECGTFLRSENKVPYLIPVGTTKIYTEGYYNNEISFVSKERFRYVGNNKWLKNFIYATIGPDNYLYLNSANPQFLYLESLYITGIFENPGEIYGLTNSSNCGFEDSIYPLEEALIPPVIELVVKELSVPRYSPEDNINNAKDNLAEVKQSK